MKTLSYRDAGFDGDGEFSGETEGEIIRQAAEYSFSEHNTPFTPEMAEKLSGQLKDDGESAGDSGTEGTGSAGTTDNNSGTDEAGGTE